jgi:hypothetical protein
MDGMDGMEDGMDGKDYKRRDLLHGQTEPRRRSLNYFTLGM